MVSKLSILKTYYHLPLEDQFSFTYEDEHYYLTNKPFPLYYQKYISLLQINPFKIINNIYQQKLSRIHPLSSTKHSSRYPKSFPYHSSLKKQNNKRNKKEWIQYYESILIYTPLNSRISDHLLFSIYSLSAFYRTFKSLFLVHNSH